MLFVINIVAIVMTEFHHVMTKYKGFLILYKTIFFEKISLGIDLYGGTHV